MPTIQYPKHPNTDTAFVIQDDGKKNRALMIAPQDITSLELPENPNSTKGYVTVSGKKQRVVLTADISGSGGGGAVTSVNGKTGDVVLTAKDVDALAQFDTMPAASADNANDIVQYTGTTNASYTNGYIYKNVATIVYTSTVSFEAATLSASTIACSGDDFAAFVAEWGSGDITTITNGTLTYDQSGGLLVFVGKDADNTTVCTFQLYTEDYQDAGFTITGTLQDGDVFAFTCGITEASATYTWTRIDVQPAPVIPDPLPSQTGNAGKFLTTDGTDASWSDKPLVNNATNNTSVSILGNATDRPNSVVIGKSANLVDNGGAIVIGASATGQSAEAVCIGNYAQTKSNFFRSIAIGYSAETDGGLCIAIGSEAKTYTAGSGKNNSIAIGNTAQIGTSSNPNVTCAMQFGKGTNTESGTVCFGLSPDDGSTWTNYKLLDSNGTVPTARLTKVNSTITLAVADWSSNTQTVNVTGMTATGVVLVSPDPTDQADYTSAGIYCSAQSAGSLEFTCTNTPTSDIDVVVVML